MHRLSLIIFMCCTLTDIECCRCNRGQREDMIWHCVIHPKKSRQIPLVGMTFELEEMRHCHRCVIFHYTISQNQPVQQSIHTKTTTGNWIISARNLTDFVQWNSQRNAEVKKKKQEEAKQLKKQAKTEQKRGL